MSKKMMLLALAVAALFALPSAASATEAHVKGITNFTGASGTGTLTASGEPTITCGATAVTGSFDSGSSTTGKIHLHFTICTATFLGIKAKCNTSGAEPETITATGTFHTITINNKPGILVTPEPTTIICAGFSNIKVAGNVIGTITSPACGASSKFLTTKFEASGSTQSHLEYTGVKYDLTAQTGTNTPVTAGLSNTTTLESGTAGTLECT
jgi:hypothetical protein